MNSRDSLPSSPRHRYTHTGTHAFSGAVSLYYLCKATHAFSGAIAVGDISCSSNRIGDVNTSKAKLGGAKYQREKTNTKLFS